MKKIINFLKNDRKLFYFFASGDYNKSTIKRTERSQDLQITHHFPPYHIVEPLGTRVSGGFTIHKKTADFQPFSVCNCAGRSSCSTSIFSAITNRQAYRSPGPKLKKWQSKKLVVINTSTLNQIGRAHV